MIRAYGDESGNAADPNCAELSIGVVIGPESVWEQFNADWENVLQRHGLPHFHMREIVGARRSGKGAFAVISNGRALDALTNDLVQTMVRYRIRAHAASVLKEDYQRVCHNIGEDVDFYAFSLYLSVVMLGTYCLNNYPRDPRFRMIMDKIAGPQKQLRQSRSLYESDKHMSWRGWPSPEIMSAKKEQGAKDLPGLQAADLIAWHYRNESRFIRPWLMEHKPRLGISDHKAWDQSLGEWKRQQIRDNYGDHSDVAITQNVFGALSNQELCKLYAYDYAQLKRHIYDNRDRGPPAHTVVTTIQNAGRAFPLSHDDSIDFDKIRKILSRARLT